LYGWIVVWSLMGFAMPALNAIMSKQVGPTEQGELQGALSCVGSITSIVAPLLLSNLFAYFTGSQAPIYFPGAGFLAAGLFLLAAVLVFARVRHEPVPQSLEAPVN
jgi:DHA1 family tetracycline resistance protein-like MFS transporter